MVNIFKYGWENVCWNQGTFRKQITDHLIIPGTFLPSSMKGSNLFSVAPIPNYNPAYQTRTLSQGLNSSKSRQTPWPKIGRHVTPVRVGNWDWFWLADYTMASMKMIKSNCSAGALPAKNQQLHWWGRTDSDSFPNKWPLDRMCLTVGFLVLSAVFSVLFW